MHPYMHGAVELLTIHNKITGSILKFPKTVQLQDRAGFPIEFSAVKEIL